MRRVAALIALAAALAGCGGGHHATTTVAAPKAAPARSGLLVGVAGPLEVSVTGARVVHGRLSSMPGYPLVLVSARTATLDAVRAAAAAHPEAHYAYVGGSTKGARGDNLVGVVLRHDEAAQLGGTVAGLVVQAQGGTEGRIAWVGPQERPLADAFAAGARSVEPGTVVLHGWSKRQPARCKEAALATLARGAVVVMAHGGLCARAATAAAHQRNRVGLALGDFELPSVAAAAVARDAVAGVYHGGEDLVFGATSGAIGIRRLDPRIPADVALQARAAAQELASARRASG